MPGSVLSSIAPTALLPTAIVGGLVASGWVAMPAVGRDWAAEHATLVFGGGMVLALASGLAWARPAPSSFAVDVTGDPPPDVPVLRSPERERALRAEGFRLLGLIHRHVPDEVDAVVPQYVTADGSVLAAPIVGQDLARVALTTILEDGFSVCSVPAGSYPEASDPCGERRVYPGGAFRVFLAAHRDRVAAVAAARSTGVARHDRALALGNARHGLEGRVRAERIAVRLIAFAAVAIALGVLVALDSLRGWAAAGAVGAGVGLVPVAFAAAARVEAALVARHRPRRVPAATLAARGSELRPVVAGPLLG
jgi:hypothetical protein